MAYYYIYTDDDSFSRGEDKAYYKITKVENSINKDIATFKQDIESLNNEINLYKQHKNDETLVNICLNYYTAKYTHYNMNNDLHTLDRKINNLTGHILMNNYHRLQDEKEKEYAGIKKQVSDANKLMITEHDIDPYLNLYQKRIVDHKKATTKTEKELNKRIQYNEKSYKHFERKINLLNTKLKNLNNLKECDTLDKEIKDVYSEMKDNDIFKSMIVNDHIDFITNSNFDTSFDVYNTRTMSNMEIDNIKNVPPMYQSIFKIEYYKNIFLYHQLSDIESRFINKLYELKTTKKETVAKTVSVNSNSTFNTVTNVIGYTIDFGFALMVALVIIGNIFENCFQKN